jgi:hypothetical protein
MLGSNALSYIYIYLGFFLSQANTFLFVHYNPTTIIYLLLYVDEMVLNRNNPILIKTLLSHDYLMNLLCKFWSSLHNFLSVKVQSNSQGLFFSQNKYVFDLL